MPRNAWPGFHPVEVGEEQVLGVLDAEKLKLKRGGAEVAVRKAEDHWIFRVT